MGNSKACVCILSARTDMLPVCLKHYCQHTKERHDLYIYQFGNRYSDNIKQKIKDIYGTNVQFITIHPEVPPEIPDSEMFYNRKYNQYARSKFPKSRLNYLHMCSFLSWGLFDRPEVKNYDFVIRFDDDSWFKKPFGFSLIDKFTEEEKQGDVFCLNSYFWGADGQFNSNHKNTREFLWNYTKQFIEQYGIIPKDRKLIDAINLDSEELFHKMGWKSDLSIWKSSFSEDENWKKWTDFIKSTGGVYKYRWGCCEIHHLYGRIFFENGVRNLNLIEKDLYHGHLPNFYIIR